MDARTIGNRLEALNNKARKKGRDDIEVQKMLKAFQLELDAADVKLAVCWLSKCRFSYTDWLKREQVQESGHGDGFILCWN